MCERGRVPKRKISTKDKHNMLLGLTALSKKSVMCVLIFTKESPDMPTKIEIDLDDGTFGSPGDDDLFAQNSASGEGFPGGPTCHFRSVDIPCLY